jgi:hypothetical protein
MKREKMTRENKPEIEFLVLKNFIAVLKKNDMYPMFRCLVGTDTRNVVSSIYKRMPSFGNFYRNQSKENIYRSAGNIETFINLMKQSFNGGLSKDEKDPAKIQHHVANCVNTLLHVFVERNVKDFHRLEMLGGDIFDSTCREIFGGDFEDMLPKPSDATSEQIRRLNEMIANGSMPRPTPEMMEQIREMLERSNREHTQMYEPEDGQPLVNEDDWDFLDDFLDEHDDRDEEFFDEEEFEEEVDEGPNW